MANEVYGFDDSKSKIQVVDKATQDATDKVQNERITALEEGGGGIEIVSELPSTVEEGKVYAVCDPSAYNEDEIVWIKADVYAGMKGTQEHSSIAVTVLDDNDAVVSDATISIVDTPYIVQNLKVIWTDVGTSASGGTYTIKMTLEGVTVIDSSNVALLEAIVTYPSAKDGDPKTTTFNLDPSTLTATKSVSYAAKPTSMSLIAYDANESILQVLHEGDVDASITYGSY